jgi:hypothetical protein
VSWLIKCMLENQTDMIADQMKTEFMEEIELDKPWSEDWTQVETLKCKTELKGDTEAWTELGGH